MKYIVASLLVLSIFSCRDTETKKTTYSLEGTWKPVKQIVTVTQMDNSSSSELYTYGDCEQSTRYHFNANKSGELVKNELRNDACVNAYTTSFTYEYDTGNNKFKMESTYNGHEEGYIDFQNANVMNLRMVTQDPNTQALITVVYTLNRVN